MPFRFRKKESITAAVRRIVREEIDKAVDEFKGVTTGKPEGLHEARKRIKKLRALLRMVRAKVGSPAVKADALLRDAAQPLGGARDAEAMIESFDALVAASRAPRMKTTFEAVRARLVARKDAMHGDAKRLPALIEGAIEKLRLVREVAQHWKITPNGFAAVAKGVAKAYCKAIDTMHRAYADPKDEHFHDWRKQVKNHWYHVRLLRGLWPKVMLAVSTELATLSDLLGDDHDLAVMRPLLTQEKFKASERVDMDALLQIIDDRRRMLRRSARALAQHLFAEKPKRLRQRFAEYWKAWHNEEVKLETLLPATSAFSNNGHDDGTDDAIPSRSEAMSDADQDVDPEPSIHIVADTDRLLVNS